MLDLIESVKDYSVLFVGDTIIDEYQYVKPLGKSPKENIIPGLALEMEWYAGGVQAAAEHARSFCRTVDIYTGFGGVRKVRYVDKNYMRKLYEVHYPFDKSDPQRWRPADVVVVTDFGHGFLEYMPLAEVDDYKGFLAINCQTNSANIGFNLITKYKKANYVVLDEYEARLAMHNNRSDIRDVMARLAADRYEKLVVTLGKRGAIGLDHTGFHECPAFTDKVIDTMGAGDAFFAVTAPMAKTGSMPDLLKIGNAAGALKTQIVGHSKPVTKQALIEFLHANHIS